MVFLKEIYEKVEFEKYQQMTKKHGKLLSRQRVKSACLVFQNEKCVAFGPGKDMFESTKIIGENQFKAAKVSKIRHMF